MARYTRVYACLVCVGGGARGHRAALYSVQRLGVLARRGARSRCSYGPWTQSEDECPCEKFAREREMRTASGDTDTLCMMMTLSRFVALVLSCFCRERLRSTRRDCLQGERQHLVRLPLLPMCNRLDDLGRSGDRAHRRSATTAVNPTQRLFSPVALCARRQESHQLHAAFFDCSRSCLLPRICLLAVA